MVAEIFANLTRNGFQILISEGQSAFWKLFN